jgi:putative endonuclease
MNSQNIGKIGENIAYKYLLNKGYLIFARNFKLKFYEIDIIARHKDGILIFCEVKTIRSPIHFENQFMPEDHLDRRKYQKMVRAAEIFLIRNHYLLLGDKGWQMDLIAIVLNGGGSANLRHYKNI